MRLFVDARVGWGHGIGRVVANTVPRVAALRPEWRLDVLVGAADLGRAERAMAGPANLRVRPSDIAPFSRREQTALPREAKGYDLGWFTNYWVPLGWRGPFVATVHDLLHLMPELTPMSRVNRTLARLTFAKLRRQARAVMFDSRFTEREFRGLVGDPRLGVTVQLGGDHLAVPATAAAKDKRILAVGTPKKHKNFALLLEAWRRAAVPADWTLTLVAPLEPMRETIDLDAMAASVRGVDLRRGIPDEELAGLFATSAIVATPSLYEGFGLPLLEAMLSGAHCLSSSAGSLVEVAEGAFVQFVNGRDLDGWTASLEQATAAIDRGTIDFPALAEHNRQRAQRFTWDRTAARIVEVLEAAGA